MSEMNQPPKDTEMDYEPDILTLEDEAGVEHTFEVVDAADMDGERYLAMVPYHKNPADGIDEEAEMIIMRVSEEDGEEVLDVVEDDEELFQAGQMFVKRLSEVFDIDLDELKNGMQ